MPKLPAQAVQGQYWYYMENTWDKKKHIDLESKFQIYLELCNDDTNLDAWGCSDFKIFRVGSFLAKVTLESLKQRRIHTALIIDITSMLR